MLDVECKECTFINKVSLYFCIKTFCIKTFSSNSHSWNDVHSH